MSSLFMYGNIKSICDLCDATTIEFKGCTINTDSHSISY